MLLQDRRHIYIYYTYRDGRGKLRNRVARLLEREGRSKEPTVILDRIPGTSIHDGGQIKFGPSGKIYITTGDAANAPPAQDLDSLAGKFLTINLQPPDFTKIEVYEFFLQNRLGRLRTVMVGPESSLYWPPATTTGGELPLPQMVAS